MGPRGFADRTEGDTIAAAAATDERHSRKEQAAAAKFPFSVHPHMLRHACGYKLANDGRDTRALQHYLGHKNIMHTVRYTELSSARFKHFWDD